MRWLLHSRRVHCRRAGQNVFLASSSQRYKSAGIGDKNATVWCCQLCIEHLCTEYPKMPPLALANGFWLGRHHPMFREATLATRMLASSARLVMRH